MVSTSYSVTGLNTIGCTSIGVLNLTVNPLPVISAFASPTMACAGEPVVFTALGAQSFEWKTSATTMQSGSPITVIPKSSAIYTVTGTDAAGCAGEASILFDIEECTGINTNFQPGSTNVYPNPSSGQFELFVSSSVSNAFEISDLTGRVILKGNFSGAKTTIDMTPFSNGVYTVKVTSENSSEVIRIIKAAN
jgi:hypothetical protein